MSEKALSICEETYKKPYMKWGVARKKRGTVVIIRLFFYEEEYN